MLPPHHPFLTPPPSTTLLRSPHQTSLGVARVAGDDEPDRRPRSVVRSRTAPGGRVAAGARLVEIEAEARKKYKAAEQANQEGPVGAVAC